MPSPFFEVSGIPRDASLQKLDSCAGREVFDILCQSMVALISTEETSEDITTFAIISRSMRDCTDEDARKGYNEILLI